jgi:hypothetical protein
MSEQMESWGPVSHVPMVTRFVEISLGFSSLPLHLPRFWTYLRGMLLDAFHPRYK